MDTTFEKEYQELIKGLEKVPQVESKEIRITLSGGVVQSAVTGSDVPLDIHVTLCDYDVGGMALEEIAEECKIENGEICIFRDV